MKSLLDRRNEALDRCTMDSCGRAAERVLFMTGMFSHEDEQLLPSLIAERNGNVDGSEFLGRH